ncbi:unnamed protein product [Diatraea saccharalis]|uniref:Single domain-containing protein n=1 Tax=Diatraea saccharalis TaxID=40085 RepID=A0A9N9RD09_9NEOP|nr:unnamed protein product [Diatraea saccharalis]
MAVRGGPAPTESFKDQFCTDPRTMNKHNAYTEWADAYSCTRHRCQPGGRNLAIYTVGCKRVEAPESAIECEEVVEDTNMQFPFCCTRLRCLVVVRGEVWTRVLGQPWETLPAAPWSHMYKMKKPPPGDTTFLPKSPSDGPVYELSSDIDNNDKVLRASKKTAPENPDCNEIIPRASVPTPDIVIALSTANDPKEFKKSEKSRERHKRGRKVQSSPLDDENTETNQHNEVDTEDAAIEKEKGSQYHQSWTEIPPNLWNDRETPIVDTETTVRDGSHSPDFVAPEEKREEKPSNLQALVDAIGTRMRDIENVVQKMSEKVHQAKPGQQEYSGEKKSTGDGEAFQQSRKHHKGDKDPEHKEGRIKKPNPDGDQPGSDLKEARRGMVQIEQNEERHNERHWEIVIRFSVRNRGSKYLHTTEITTEQPVFIEDTNLNGYFSDASNNLVRRSNQPKASIKKSYHYEANN